MPARKAKLSAKSRTTRGTASSTRAKSAGGAAAPSGRGAKAASGAAKKKAAKAAVTKKAAPKKAAPKKAAPKKAASAAPKMAAPKKAAPKKAAPKKAAPKSAAPKKAAPKKAAPKKAAPKKAASAAPKPKKLASAARTAAAPAGLTASAAPPARTSKPPALAARRPSRPPGPALPRGFASPKDVQILVVDDEPEVLNLLVPFLEKRGYTVTEADDGDQALEKILTDRPHVVLLDVMMPGLNGWEITRYVRDREELESVRIVMATGIGEEMNAATAPLHGADAYIDKPFRLDDVERVVLDVLERLDRGELGRGR